MPFWHILGSCSQITSEILTYQNRLLENGKQNGGKLNYSDIVFSQRDFLKRKYYPVAIKYFFSENELEDFKKNTNYKTAFYPYTFCHYVARHPDSAEI